MTDELTRWHNLHKGETVLLVGNGPNLLLTPPEWFNYPSFGLNTIHKYQGIWRPTYYAAVDHCLYRDYGEDIKAKFPDVPKFVPSPKLDMWQGDNFIRFYHRPGSIMVGGHSPFDKDALQFGLGFKNVMHAAIQIAAHMGFTTLLIIGMQQKPGWASLQEHFWGRDTNTPESQTDEHWNDGYLELRNSLNCIRILNISHDTYVPENIVPRGDWREWRNA